MKVSCAPVGVGCGLFTTVTSGLGLSAIGVPAEYTTVIALLAGLTFGLASYEALRRGETLADELGDNRPAWLHERPPRPYRHRR